MDRIITNQSFAGRREKVKGKDFAVYPVVLMVEGVHHAVNGSPVYYPLSTLQDSALHWEGRPIPVMHPNVGGDYVRANNPHVEADWVVGRIYNASVQNGKLKGEAWIEVKEAERIAPGLIMSLDSGAQMEVSTGVLVQGDGVAGAWNGEQFNQTITSMVPDHLALLPGDKGACSWEDGCGIRANQSKENKNKKITGKTGSANENFIKILATPGGEMDSDKLAFAINQLNQQETDADRLSLLGDMALDFLGLTKETDEGETNMSDTKPCCPEKVSALITNENTAFTESDREFLNNMGEEQIDKLFHSIISVTANAGCSQEAFDEMKAELANMKKKLTANAEAKTADEFIGSAPPEIAAVLNAGLAELNKKKEVLTKSITANTRNTFSPEQLAGMALPQLEAIAALAAPADFSVNAGAPGSTAPDEEVPYVSETKLFA